MSIIQIDSVTTSKTGKSLLVKGSGKTYFAKLDSGLLGKQGETIEAETKASEKDGNTFVWIEKWKKASAEAAPSASIAQGGINMAFLPFVSNVVAHAIQVGKIEGPAGIAAWANAAYDAACNLKEAEPF